jgi:hypothetical protein
MSSQLDDRIRTMMQRVVDESPPPPDLPTGPPPALVAPQRVPNWAAAVGAAVAVFILIGGVVWLVGGTGSRELADEPIASTTTTPIAVTTIPAAPATTIPAPIAPVPPPSLDSVESWQRVGGDIMDPIGGLFSITSAGERLVAVGDDAGEDGRPDGVILVSDDGFTWTRIAENDPALTLGAVLMYAVTEGGPGLVAVGGGCDDPDESCPIRSTVWTSVDGTTWTRAPYDIDVFGTGVMEDIVVTNHGIVAVGSHNGVNEVDVTQRPAVWTSPDGIEWARTWEGAVMTRGQPDVDPPETGAFLLSPIQAITVGPDGTLVAVGTVVDDLGVGVAAVWTSGDGQTWERVPHDPEALASSTGMDMVMLDVAAGESGLVAVGSERDHHGAGLWWMGGERPAVWTSPDGTAWERITLDDEAFGTTRSISAVAASPTGFVAAGPIFADSGRVTMWTSPDGTRWQAVARFETGYVLSVIDTGPAMAAAGGISDEYDRNHAVVWVGPSGS